MSMDKELKESIEKGASLSGVPEEEKKRLEEEKKKRLEEVEKLKQQLKEKGVDVDADEE